MRFRSIIGTAAAASTLVMTGAVTAGPASAAVLSCGTVLSTPGQTVTLTANVGPCNGGDGVTITAPNVTLNLGGFKIIGKRHAGDAAGVRLANVTGVTVKGKGTVQGFDAGVAIFGGSGNTVSNLIAKDNVNDFQGGSCDLGDGISMTDSSNNTIQGNKVVGNGPYGGISVVENSDGNTIKGNTVVSQNLHGIGCGNSTQDEGIRLEGPGANNNVVNGNTVSDSLLGGIGVHSNIGCRNNPPAPGDTPNNDFNIITNNTVTGTTGSSQSDGIKLLAQGPFGTVVCAASNTTITGNNSSNNSRNGITIPATSVNNIVNDNTVNANGTPGAPAIPGPATPGVGDGIHLGEPIFGNVFTDIGPTNLDLISPAQPTFIAGTDFAALEGSGSSPAGGVTGTLVPIGNINVVNPAPDSSTSGCTAADFPAAVAGNIALIQRGFCDRTLKIANAVAAGAIGVVFFNEGSPGRTGLIVAGVDPVNIPVIDATFATGQKLFNLTQQGPVTINVEAHTTNINTEINVGAENNTLSRNVGFNNVERDGRDDNPKCDNNAWTANKFGTVNQPCVKAGGGTGQVKPIAP
ncbi:MAG: PA domain-containing protein [Acidimicrobiales bacterium]